MLLTGTFLGTEYTSLTTFVSEGGGGSGSSACEYVCKKTTNQKNPNLNQLNTVFFNTYNPLEKLTRGLSSG